MTNQNKKQIKETLLVIVILVGCLFADSIFEKIATLIF